jgi:hypothetical protein
VVVGNAGKLGDLGQLALADLGEEWKPASTAAQSRAEGRFQSRPASELAIGGGGLQALRDATSSLPDDQPMRAAQSCSACE